MLTLAQHRGFKPEAVLFDGWYASQANLVLIQSLSWVWITRLKGNRVVNRLHHLEEIDVPETGLIVELKFVGPTKVFKFIAQDGDIEYWVTNNLDLEAKDIRKTTALRWKIEEYHRIIEDSNNVLALNAARPGDQDRKGRISFVQLWPFSPWRNCALNKRPLGISPSDRLFMKQFRTTYKRLLYHWYLQKMRKSWGHAAVTPPAPPKNF
jgi:hypothetical protein